MSLMRPRQFAWFLIFGFVFLSGCGGSGSDSDPESVFSLSGTVSVKPFTSVDEDVQTANEFVDQNNSFEDAQVVTNPISLGGYLSGSAGTFDSGADYAIDDADFYRGYFLAGQRLSLSVYYSEDQSLSTISITANLYAADDQSTVVDTVSFNTSKTDSIDIPQDGNYVVRITANNNSAPVLYTLSLSKFVFSSSNLAQPKPISTALFAEFVPGEVVVGYKDVDSSADNDAAGKPKRFASSSFQQGLTQKMRVSSRHMVLKADDVRLNQALSFEKDDFKAAMNAKTLKKWQTLALIEQLKKDDNVEFAEPNYIFRATGVQPNDPEFPRQWNLPMIELPAAWELTRGAGVTVAVIDTGIASSHIDLVNNLALSDGYDFVSDSGNGGDGNGMDSDPRDLGDSLHGTHVAGIIGAEGDNEEGIAGVAYEATILPLRALGIDDTGTSADIANAILYAAGLPNGSGTFPNTRADIINLSLSASPSAAEPNGPVLMREAVADAVAEGVIVIAAAGNSGTEGNQYPAAFDDVVAVGSVNYDKSKSSFSSFGDYIDVVAPGGTSSGDDNFDGFLDGILSTVIENEYEEYIGTSMAAPHVAGVAALMKSLDGNIDSTVFNQALIQGLLTEDLGNPTFFGNGLINAAIAVSFAAEPGTSIPATLNVFPSNLSFLGANTETALRLSNPGDGTVTVDVTTSDTWIEIIESNVQASGLGEYLIRIDSSAIPVTGVLAGALTLDYELDGGPTEQTIVRVFASNSSSVSSGVGELYVYLLSLSDVQASEQNDSGFIDIYSITNGVKNNDGTYSYSFENIPAGDYFLEASTDNDFDLIYQDGGEARGAYPFFSRSQLIEVSNDLTALDFELEFSSPSSSSLQVTAEQGVVDSSLRYKPRINRKDKD